MCEQWTVLLSVCIHIFSQFTFRIHKNISFVGFLVIHINVSQFTRADLRYSHTDKKWSSIALNDTMTSIFYSSFLVIHLFHHFTMWCFSEWKSFRFMFSATVQKVPVRCFFDKQKLFRFHFQKIRMWLVDDEKNPCPNETVAKKRDGLKHHLLLGNNLLYIFFSPVVVRI